MSLEKLILQVLKSRLEDQTEKEKITHNFKSGDLVKIKTETRKIMAAIDDWGSEMEDTIEKTGRITTLSNNKLRVWFADMGRGFTYTPECLEKIESVEKLKQELSQLLKPNVSYHIKGSKNNPFFFIGHYKENFIFADKDDDISAIHVGTLEGIKEYDTSFFTVAPEDKKKSPAH